MPLTALFLANDPASKGALLTVHSPDGSSKGSVLFVPPFAEEMMKSRQQFTQLARALNCHGYLCAILDVQGTGDAMGELEAMTWDIWCDDVARAYNALAPYGPIGGIGLRLGALLLADAAMRHSLSFSKCTMWEPQTAGKTAIKQFLRIAAVASKMQGKTAESGSAVDGQEVGGYWVSNALEQSIASVVMPTTPPAKAVQIIRLSNEPEPTIPPGWRGMMEAFRMSGATVDASALSCPGFWSTTEITTSEALTERTVAWWIT